MKSAVNEAFEDMRANPFDLRQLIAQENDPKMRVLLMLVNNSNDNLAANTVAVEANISAINELANRLDKHLVTFEQRALRDDEIRNQGKGAWRILAWVLGLAQAAGAYVWVDIKAEIKELHLANISSQKAEASLESRINSIEAVTRTNRP